MKSDEMSLEASRANGTNKNAIKTISGASSFATERFSMINRTISTFTASPQEFLSSGRPKLD